MAPRTSRPRFRRCCTRCLNALSRQHSTAQHSTAQHIKNPLETGFFLWVNLAYLQPFEAGNKRVSRLAANVPLMLYNQAPLSFLDVDREDYALAMMGVYESCDVSMAVDLFDWM